MPVKIFVDPGHGGPDPGAVGNQVEEHAVNLAVATALTQLLREGGYEVMQYRTTRDEHVLSDKNADLTNRAAMANAWGADYFISIHTNSSTNPSANGFEAYVYRLGGPAEALAQSIVRAVTERLGSKDNGVRRANFAVLRRTDMPATLLELGYLTNPTEALNLNSPAWRQAMAQAIYDGIYAYVRP